MYTVIIQSRSAKESYDEFYPLLANTVYEKSDVRVCDWIEEGKTLETAVPELLSVVERKKQWRAIVVQLDLGDDKPEYQTTEGNPYDFLQYHEQSFQDRICQGDIAWSNIPLVRITQMLKGIPEPVLMFSDDGDSGETGEGEASQEINFDRPELTERKKSEVIKWNETFVSHFSPPAEILLVRTRRLITGVRGYEMESKWEAFRDIIDSSLFRQNNGYAEDCRFLVFDVDVRGELRRRSDMFRLWLCIQLLSENRINSNLLQADRLYRMDVELEEKKLSANLQKTADQLNYAQFGIANLPKDAPSPEDAEQPAEIDVEKSVDVDLGRIDSSAFQIDEETFRLTPENRAEDKLIWKNYTENARQRWLVLLRSVSRKLAKAANTLRTISKPDPRAVSPLSEYQVEDLRDLLDEHYTMILQEQENLPANEFDLKDALEKQDREVQKAIRTRLRKKSALRVRVWPSVLVAASLCYGFFAGGSPVWLGAAAAVSVLLILLYAYIVLKVRFRSFVSTVKGYEAIYNKALDVLNMGDLVFSSFFSRIASRIYGENYLSVLDQKRARLLEQKENIERKIRRVEWFQATLERWCEALQLDVDMNNQEAVRTMAENKHRLREEALYQLDTCRPRSVEIGQSGSYIRTSYDFIGRMLIEREEVFDRE